MRFQGTQAGFKILKSILQSIRAPYLADHTNLDEEGTDSIQTVSNCIMQIRFQAYS